MIFYRNLNGYSSSPSLPYTWYVVVVEQQKAGSSATRLVLPATQPCTSERERNASSVDTGAKKTPKI